MEIDQVSNKYNLSRGKHKTAIAEKRKADHGGAPLAGSPSYLRVVFMNAAGTAVTATHTIDMGTAAQGSELTTAYEQLQLLNLAAPADGFAAVYVANKSPTDVYFDNLEVELEQYQENQSCATPLLCIWIEHDRHRT